MFLFKNWCASSTTRIRGSVLNLLCLARFNKNDASALAVISFTENEDGIFSKLILKICSSFCSMNFSIFSTIDLDQQEYAKNAISKHLAALEKDYPWLSSDSKTSPENDSADMGSPMNIEAALIAIDPKTGFITASAGGRNYSNSNFNRVLLGSRQPGSVFKPFILLTCFNDKRGIQTVTPKTLVLNTPLTIQYDGQSWSPKNYDNEFSDPVNIYKIITKSINIPTVRLAKHIGFDQVYKTTQLLGLKTPIYKIPSISLGSLEATVIEIARAYSVLANGGLFIEPTTIAAITDSNGKLVYQANSNKTRVVSEESTYMVSELLKYNIKIGTGKLADIRGLSIGFYGKTGTSSNDHDAWFAGYTKDLVVVVWVGFDTKRDIKLSGSVAALPIWIDFMSKIYKNSLPPEISPPENISFSNIELFNEIKRVPFIKGTDHLKPPTIF